MIDVQNFGVDPKGGAFAKLGERELDDANRFLSLVHATTLPNQARLLRACRDAGIEVI
jgi:nicotinamidase-related amidase